MAVVIHLQGVPIAVGTMDFSGLTIPDGGVHIVGGELGEAFIVFAVGDCEAGVMGADIKKAKLTTAG